MNPKSVVYTNWELKLDHTLPRSALSHHRWPPSQFILHLNQLPLQIPTIQFEYLACARDRNAGTMAAMVVSSQHSAIFSVTSEKNQEWWPRLNAQYAVRCLHVQQHATSMLRRASVKAQPGNHPLIRWHMHNFDFGVKAKALGSSETIFFF